MLWYSRLTDNKPLPFEEYKGHRAFIYYKLTTRMKNISLNLAWLTYGAAICTFRNDRIIKFCCFPLDKDIQRFIVRHGAKQIILSENEE